MIYDLTTLSLLPNMLGPVMQKLPETYANFTQTGRILGAFSCEFGVLNRFTFLTAYEDTAALGADRQRRMAEADPYGIGQYLGGATSTAFEPFSFCKDIEPGDHGPFYEFRTYTLAPFGRAETEAAWAKIVERRNEISPLMMVMTSIEGGPQKIAHIWPYKSLDDRVKARAAASAEGIWPPPGGSTHLTSLQSELFVATGVSDLK
ncbi:NIPSNAP family protein [Roseisalinus antarcticus]|uniref:NIPSNAP domain-containing protein n=1 Tax=Roseisalinus antarcticus TaxID=254357 RepID=A0A1Y5T627_9RHOB|nr:NIPSNAP family protein [Roseisalinus antarcticus]SLN56314.1 hypothetical protein ROA7023_02545 [Roseisalinus antarcticus]